MNSAVCHIFFLFSAVVFPVNNCISAHPSGSCSSNDLKCCSISGLVGARMTTFSSGNFLNLSMAVISAIKVFPVPVGKTTRQSFSLHVSKMAFW